MKNETQLQMFYRVSRSIGEVNQLFLELVKDGLTREELQKLIDKRPELWQRFDTWLDKLPSKKGEDDALQS